MLYSIDKLARGPQVEKKSPPNFNQLGYLFHCNSIN